MMVYVKTETSCAVKNKILGGILYTFICIYYAIACSNIYHERKQIKKEMDSAIKAASLFYFSWT